MSRYIIELREYTDSGDYIENDYDFDNRSEAIKFARQNKVDLYAFLDYEDRDCDPKNLTHKI